MRVIRREHTRLLGLFTCRGRHNRWVPCISPCECTQRRRNGRTRKSGSLDKLGSTDCMLRDVRRTRVVGGFTFYDLPMFWANHNYNVVDADEDDRLSDERVYCFRTISGTRLGREPSSLPLRTPSQSTTSCGSAGSPTLE